MDRLQGKHFLIIDDDPVLRSALVGLIRRDGGTADEAATHKVGFEKLQAGGGGSYHAVISDNNMVKTGGAVDAGMEALPELIQFGLPVFLYTIDSVGRAVKEIGAYFISKLELPENIPALLAADMEDFALRQAHRKAPPRGTVQITGMNCV